MSAEASTSTAHRSKKQRGPDADVGTEASLRKRGRKPIDEEDAVDPWTIEPFLPPSDPSEHRPFLEESSFALLFPKYREPYLRSAWAGVTSALEAVGLACELDLVQGQMTVKTTRKTWDPYVVLKGRDMLKLLARGVNAPQAAKVLSDGVACDIIQIGTLVRNKERFVKRRQRIVGPDGSTLKAIELLTECYVLVQGNTVSAMGSHKGLKEVRRIVLDCMNNVHPIYRIKELMIRRELAKDPKLAKESWDRFLPRFQKKHLKTSEKTAKKNAAVERKETASSAAPSTAPAVINAPAETAPAKEKKVKPNKKVYTPFPPPQPPSKLDLQLASGEYFLKPKQREAIARQQREDRQKEVAESRKAVREEAFIAPPETAAPRVHERKRKRAEELM